MMDEFGRITFDDSIGVADAKLMLIDQQPVGRRFAFEKRDRSFDSPNAADERAREQRDDAEMRDEKGDVMFFPGPAGKRRDREIRREKNKPEIEPGRAIDVRARHFRVEGRFVNRAGDRADDEHGEQNDREFERSEKAENRIALPVWARSGSGCSHR